LTTLVAGAVLLALGAVATACGGASLEEYSQKANAIQNDVWFAEPETQWLLAEGASGEEVAAQARDFIQEGADGWSETSAAFAELDPPAEVEDAHDRLVEALNDSAAAFQAIADGLPDTVSVSGAEEAEEWLAAQFETAEVNAAFSRPLTKLSNATSPADAIVNDLPDGLTHSKSETL